ncbi:MAG: peptidyl-prolyl cis-trans isomerase, partial [Candidatus Omnitrophica bacterium]|nr:peptidyl-prolyl cis-trans isomerase [Candidatus Omnitrophota bacterium]
AAEFGLQIKESGLFSESDPIPGVGWVPQITSRLTKAKAGDYLPVIHMDKYYYILKVKEIKAPYIPDFESIKDRVKETLVKEEAKKIARAKIEECLKILTQQAKPSTQSADFERAAKEQGLKSGVTAMFKYGSYIEGIGGSDIFWTKASELKEGQASDIISAPNGFYIIKLKSRSGVDENKFTQEKTGFAKNLLLQKKSEYFAEFTDKLWKQSRTFF